MLDHLIEFLTADHIVPNRERGRTILRLGKTSVVGKVKVGNADCDGGYSGFTTNPLSN